MHGIPLSETYVSGRGVSRKRGARRRRATTTTTTTAAAAAAAARRLTNRDGRAARAEISFGRHDLVVERAHGEAEALPRVEVVGGRDRPARPLLLADREVLVERRRAIDRGLVHARALRCDVESDDSDRIYEERTM